MVGQRKQIIANLVNPTEQSLLECSVTHKEHKNMAFSIECIKEAVVKVKGQAEVIPVGLIMPMGEPELNSEPSQKDEPQEWIAYFSGSCSVGKIVWAVQYTLELSGATLGSVDIVEKPEGAEIVTNPTFAIASE